ncbi:MAG: MFS transporter [Nitrospira sp.]|nr:MFS transporter [Nitrospira sp.]
MIDQPGESATTALKFVVLLGVVSLFADMTYEAARSITGPYLALLGASGTIVGVVAGFGELIGYALRLVSGYMADKTGKYWGITIVGYGINLVAVPLLALAGRWELAAFFIIAERVGKAIRTPARDAMLSHATAEMGRGWGFGVHEALDQVGAMLGPLIVAAVFYFKGSYQTGFAVLAIPAVLALSVLIAARMLYPRPRDLEVEVVELKAEGFPRVYWFYVAAAAFVAAGYADFPLIAYHFGKASTVPEVWIPVFYAIAMGADALAALIFGRLYDRMGISILIVAVLLSSLFAPLVFQGGFYASLGGMILWGLGMGAQESIMRAGVAGMVSPNKRGSAYGIFSTGFGLYWFLGSAAMGWFYDVSIPLLVAFSVGTQLLAVPLFVMAKNHEVRS